MPGQAYVQQEPPAMSWHMGPRGALAITSFAAPLPPQAGSDPLSTRQLHSMQGAAGNEQQDDSGSMDGFQPQLVPRSSYLEEYSKHRPLSAGMRPRTLLNKVAAAAGLGVEDSDAEVDADAWVLDGWGEEPSVPEKAQQASTKMLSKWARNLPSALPPTTAPVQRRILSAGPHRPGAAARKQGAPSGPRRKQAQQQAGSSAAANADEASKQAAGRRHASTLVVRHLLRSQHADLEVGDESDVEPDMAVKYPSKPAESQQPPQSAGSTASSNGSVAAAQAKPAAVCRGPPLGQQTQGLVNLLRKPSPGVERIGMDAPVVVMTRSSEPVPGIAAASGPLTTVPLHPVPASAAGLAATSSKQPEGGGDADRPAHNKPGSSGSNNSYKSSKTAATTTSSTLELDSPGQPLSHSNSITRSTQACTLDSLPSPSGAPDTLPGTARATSLATGMPASARAAAAAAAALANAGKTAAQQAAAQQAIARQQANVKARLQADLELLLQRRVVLQRPYPGSSSQIPDTPSLLPNIGTAVIMEPAIMNGKSDDPASPLHAIHGSSAFGSAKEGGISASKPLGRQSGGVSVVEVGDRSSNGWADGRASGGVGTVPSLPVGVLSMAPDSSPAVRGGGAAGRRPGAAASGLPRQPVPTAVQQLELQLPPPICAVQEPVIVGAATPGVGGGGRTWDEGAVALQGVQQHVGNKSVYDQGSRQPIGRTSSNREYSPGPVGKAGAMVTGVGPDPNRITLKSPPAIQGVASAIRSQSLKMIRPDSRADSHSTGTLSPHLRPAFSEGLGGLGPAGDS